MMEPWVGQPSKEGPVGYLLSTDRGTKVIHLEGDRYKGRIAIAYPDSLSAWRSAIAELQDKIPKLAAKKGAGNIWIVVDTVNHMQNQLMTEARMIEVKATTASKKTSRKAEEAYVRDATTRVDYNINLCHMAELTNGLLKLPANILMLTMEKEARDHNDRTVYLPALTGQSREKIPGDADVLARMVIDSGTGERQLLLAPGKGYDAVGDRTGRLSAVEPADLTHLRNKIFGNTTQEEGTS